MRCTDVCFVCKWKKILNRKKCRSTILMAKALPDQALARLAIGMKKMIDRALVRPAIGMKNRSVNGWMPKTKPVTFDLVHKIDH
jgi:hypothetical protein